jgi:hypothetical protein
LFLGNLELVEPIKKFAGFMEPESSSPCSQNSGIAPYPELSIFQAVITNPSLEAEYVSLFLDFPQFTELECPLPS